MPIHPAASDDAPIKRKHLMKIVAKADPAALKVFLGQHAAQLAIAPVRGPETGLVMVRGRIGGGGSPFNLGEVTMSRASIRLESGEIGHGQVLGSNREHARLCAIIDAIAQIDRFVSPVERLLVELESLEQQKDQQLIAETQATKVDFFTLVRGED